METRTTFTLTRIIVFGHRLDLLKSFYVNDFNFTVVEEIENQWLVLNAGHTELAFHKVGPGYEPPAGEKFVAESNTKLVFGISGDIYHFREKLAREGVDIGDVKKFDGINSLFCDGHDPEGNVFQLEQKLA
ncbi:MAG TPA: hypothetical protein PK325_08835 [Cyclobacteriaceae bacterium]|nr:hypothetical protein [Cyclobacteriaceae bacterium]HMV08855.1 hypothetical protein [Cyclobacteriaceae bacterium]HMX00002.1 hypothetical protein [Cyclobacteriaceae bacterium]HMX49136.1 hypothetical protein [Cyclobacteriaceae bacterium]HMY92822.1 hypothetical protein [Cyclobacteriaceae bacterium]